MKQCNHGLWLRLGFGVFLAVWGLDRIVRVDMWASESLMGHFYGAMGLMHIFIISLGASQLLIALSLFTNCLVRYSSILLLAMLTVSTFVTISPMLQYLFLGGNPIPAIIFVDHFPLLAGAWAIFAHAKQKQGAC